jgi:Ni/Co efflux regulator RcnB
MRSLFIPALALTALALPAMGQAAESPRADEVYKHTPGRPMITRMKPAAAPQKRQWSGGWQAPGGWAAYARPSRGFILPDYWVQPAFFIANWATYGLPRPSAGLGWSRYYNDAVLTDRDGRVVDALVDYPWDRYIVEGEDDGDYDYAAYPAGYDDYVKGKADTPPPAKSGKGVAGAVAGGAVGAIAGSVIAGHGNRTAGALIGAGVGAVTGAAIETSADKAKRSRIAQAAPPPPPGSRSIDYGSGYDQAGDGVTYGGQWTGHWEGRWVEDKVPGKRVYEGVYRGAYDSAPHWTRQEATRARLSPAEAVDQQVVLSDGRVIQVPAGTTSITIHSQPVVTTTTTTEYVNQVVRVPMRSRVAPKRVRVAPKAKKPVCVCRVEYR